MRVGFAGLGRMGVPMARNLARAGFPMTLWNRSQDKARSLADEIGATVAETPAQLAQAADVVATMLADDRASEQVHFDSEGLFAAPGACVLVEMGTMSPDHISALAAAAPPGYRVVDAPVSGATEAAAHAKLLFMVGGAESECRELSPLFSTMGRQTRYLGRTGAGAVMKLAVNNLIHGLNQNLAETLVLAEAAGIATETAYDVIEASAAAAPMLKYRRPLYLDEAAHDVTFTVALARKDMALTIDLARKFGVQMPQSNLTHALLDAAMAKGFASRDMASMLAFMRERP